MAFEDKAAYMPKDAVGLAIESTLITGAAGLAISAIQNTLTKQNVSGWGVFTRSGGVIAMFAASGGIYGFAKAAAANLREKDDSWNPAIGGFLSGGVFGLRFRTFPAVLGFGAGLAVVQGAFDYTGGKFSGYDKDSNVDEYERKEALRKNRRRPIQETLEQLGEGRGVYGPAYRERRADRIKENYGIGEAGKGSSDSDAKAEFFRRFKQQETTLQEKMARLKQSALQPAERANLTDQCLASISRLSNEAKDASAYLLAYDQRTCSTAVRFLHENLQEIRNASASKRKFAFKKTIAQKNAANSGNGPPEDVSVRSQGATGDEVKTASSNEPDHHSSDPQKTQDSLDAGPVSGTAGAITIASLSSTQHRFDFASSEPGSSVSITNIHHSAVDLSDSLSRPFATLAINSVTESLLICGRTSGAAHITGVENSTLIVWSRQVHRSSKTARVYYSPHFRLSMIPLNHHGPVL
ncbi:MAG: hypothetical protein ASARMPRED_005711 [Alectoria sarmentosa]|nr:MAG: hypothetical protein ASARMPRED_005711 [Alectoria sarmentosa]